MSELLTLDDIAARVGESREYIRRCIIVRPGFPRPSLVLSRKVKKWDRLDIERWLEKQRAKWAA